MRIGSNVCAVAGTGDRAEGGKMVIRFKTSQQWRTHGDEAGSIAIGGGATYVGNREGSVFDAHYLASSYNELWTAPGSPRTVRGRIQADF